MKTIDGDLLELARQGKFDVIVHGCNCFHTMGGGIALQIRKKYPEAYTIDCKETNNGDRGKLGSYSFVSRTFFVPELEKAHELTIINAYTQYDFGKHGRNVDYEAVSSAFAEIKRNFHGKRIAYPMIGAGLAGGNWEIIKLIIADELKDEDHTLVVYNG